MSSVVEAGNDFTVTNGAFLVLESLHPCMPFTIESPKTTTFFFLGCSSASVCAEVLEFGCGDILVFFVFALFLELPGLLLLVVDWSFIVPVVLFGLVTYSWPSEFSGSLAG